MLTNRDEIIILVLRNLSEKHVFRLILSLISSKLRIFSLKSPFWYSKIMFFRAESVIHNYSEMLCQTYNIIFRSFGQSHFRSFSFSIFFLSRHYPWPQRVFRQSLSLLRCEEGIRSIFWIKEWGINKRLWE